MLVSQIDVHWLSDREATREALRDAVVLVHSCGTPADEDRVARLLTRSYGRRLARSELRTLRCETDLFIHELRRRVGRARTIADA